MLAVGLACVVAVLLEIGAITGFFGLTSLLHRTTGAAEPDLNPSHELIFSVESNVTYIGSISGYLPALEDTDLCGYSCPTLPQIWVPKQGSLPPEIGIYFYFNITNTAAAIVNLSVPVLVTSGPDPTLFYLQTWCCYTKTTQMYDELLDDPIQFPAHFQFGIEGYAYTTVPLPAVPAGGYALDISYTSS